MQPCEVAWKYLSLGRSVIPTGKGENGKKPHLRTWIPYQHRLPLEGDVLRWAELKPTSWAMVCGPVSEITTIDCDNQEATGIFTSFGLQPHITSPRGGSHFYLAEGFPTGIRTVDGIKFEVRGAGTYANFTGSTPDGQYTTHQIALDGADALWHISDVGRDVQRVLQGIVRGCRPTKRVTPSGPVYEGQRNVYLTSLAGRLRLTMNAEETRRVLMAVNIADCRPPIDWEEVGRIADSVRRYGYQAERTMQIPDSHMAALSRLNGVSFSAYRVLLELIRQTRGFGQVKATIWRGNLETATGIVGPHNVSRAIAELRDKNIIEVQTNGKGRNQGPSTFAVLEPDQWAV